MLLVVVFTLLKKDEMDRVEVQAADQKAEEAKKEGGVEGGGGGGDDDVD